MLSHFHHGRGEVALRSGVHMGLSTSSWSCRRLSPSLLFGFVMVQFLHNNRMLAVAAGGLCTLAAALLMQQHVEDPLTASIANL